MKSEQVFLVLSCLARTCLESPETWNLEIINTAESGKLLSWWLTPNNLHHAVCFLLFAFSIPPCSFLDPPLPAHLLLLVWPHLHSHMFLSSRPSYFLLVCWWDIERTPRASQLLTTSYKVSRGFLLILL
jgi:hypothetical protein